MKRGSYLIDCCCLETSSFLGLWAFRKRFRTSCEVRVYPNLMKEGEHAAALFLRHHRLGAHPLRQIGKGREFERLRDYAPGDSYDEISWKASARRHRPVTKVLQIERTQEVYVCIDASRLSGRPWLKSGAAQNEGEDIAGKDCDVYLDHFIGAGLVLGLAAQKQGDLFGVAAFDESVRAFFRAAASRSHHNTCREQLFNVRAKPVNPDYEELFTFIRLKLRRRALVMVLTSLDDPLLAETFERAMELVCHDHLLYVTMLRPDAARPIFSNPDVSSSNGICEELSSHIAWRSLHELDASLKKRGVHFALVDQERLCMDLLSQYMRVKQRQLL